MNSRCEFGAVYNSVEINFTIYPHLRQKWLDFIESVSDKYKIEFSVKDEKRIILQFRNKLEIENFSKDFKVYNLQRNLSKL